MMMNKTKMSLEKIDEEFLPYEDQVKLKRILLNLKSSIIKIKI
jgi:hypothetical protein